MTQQIPTPNPSPWPPKYPGEEADYFNDLGAEHAEAFAGFASSWST